MENFFKTNFAAFPGPHNYGPWQTPSARSPPPGLLLYFIPPRHPAQFSVFSSTPPLPFFQVVRSLIICTSFVWPNRDAARFPVYMRPLSMDDVPLSNPACSPDGSLHPIPFPYPRKYLMSFESTALDFHVWSRFSPFLIETFQYP